jgi:hypothetical protein
MTIMAIHAGDHITYCMMPGMERYRATVFSIDSTGIVLQLHNESPAEFSPGQYLMISEAGEDIDYYSEVAGRDGTTLRLKRMWTGKRGFFRVDDVFPVLYRQVSGSAPMLESKIFSGYAAEITDEELPDETINPRLWKLLNNMNVKLSLILERLHLESEGLTKAESIPVNISASGMRFTLDQKHSIEDVFEIKILLPTYPPIGILTHGKVVRVEESDKGRYATSLHYINMGDDVRDVIIQYTLRRQREIVRRYRERGQSA